MRRLLAAGFLLASLFGFQGKPTPVHARPSPSLPLALEGKRLSAPINLLFATGGYENGHIDIVRRGVIRQLTHFPYPATVPIPSRDGSSIEFLGPGRIGLMNADGADAHFLPSTNNCYPGDWGPADTWIVINCGGTPLQDNGKLVLIPLHGGSRRVLSHMPPGESPTVNPFAGTVTFARLDGWIYLVSPQGGKTRRLVQEDLPMNAWSPAWAPDGRALLFYSHIGGSSLQEVNADGSDRRTIRQLPAWNADLSATFSPNGKNIIFSGSSDREADLYVVDAHGKHLKRLTSGGIVGDPYWLPTGIRH